jgi:hypothetical protein
MFANVANVSKFHAYDLRLWYLLRPPKVPWVVGLFFFIGIGIGKENIVLFDTL